MRIAAQHLRDYYIRVMVWLACPGGGIEAKPNKKPASFRLSEAGL
jgi:hypothetical protein